MTTERPHPTTAAPGDAIYDAVRSFMDSMIDYAGLFPPAKLDMSATVKNYATYRAGAHRWMLGKLIVPVARFAEFEEQASSLLPKGADEPWSISALTASADDGEAFAHDLKTIAAFNDRHANPAKGLARVDAVELKVSKSAALDAALDAIPDEIEPFFEIAADRDPRGLITMLSGSGAGAKIRTGGITPDLFPTPEQVARFIGACASAGVPFKATAGLHHPFRHASQGVPGATEFGFVNIFLGAALTLSEQLELADLERILSEEIIDHFVFDHDAIGWDGLFVSTEEVEDCRTNFARSYGSCSFIEPIEDLENLRLLKPAS